MAILKCKMCGGDLTIQDGMTVAECEYCGTTQTLPKLVSDDIANLYDRANHFRRNNEFDKAEGIYERILSQTPEDSEAYWSLVLCRYGIEYVEDPATHKRVPTVNRTQYTSVFDDENYKSAIAHADAIQRRVYEEEAAAINEIQKGILAISQKEEPFDVFICYKETDRNGRRTPDSVLATDLYHQLTNEGFKVFFARITLEDKLGSAYEPYIFAALNSAKVMVVLGTKPEYFNAVWVKNEWSRYLALVRQSNGKKVLIPAYRDMDPYDLPEEFSHLQAQDMSKLGFMQDLIRGIKKITSADKPKAQPQVVSTVAGASDVAPLLKRMFMYLEDGEWDKANEYAERVLDKNPESAEAYVGKLMADRRVRRREALKDQAQPFDDNRNYQKAIRFADAALENELTGCIRLINDRNAETKRKQEEERRRLEKKKREEEQRQEEERRKNAYDEAVTIMNNASTEDDYKRAESAFYSASGYKDADALAKKCNESAETCRKDSILCKAKESMQKDTLESCFAARNDLKSITGWKDADDLLAVCETKISEKEEEERIAAKKKKKRFITIGSIAAAVIALVVAFVIVLNTVIIPKKIINEAKNLADNGNYLETIKKLNEIPNNQEAKELRDELPEQLAKEGKNIYSANLLMSFGLNEENKQLYWERSRKQVISAGLDYTVGLKADGTVIAVGYNDFGQCDVQNWTDIVAVSAGDDHTVGLKSDGTVVAVGKNNSWQCDVENWTDIVAVSAGDSHTVGLKSDGTVVAVGDNDDGQCDVTKWKNIVAVSAGEDHTVGLKADGTVVAVGANTTAQCDVQDWKDIVAVSAGTLHTVGLKSDGTVVAVGDHIACNVLDWKDIVAVSAGNRYTVGLKSDGTAVAVGGYMFGRCDVQDWKDIVAISAGCKHTVGLKADGTVVAVGYKEDGQCDVSDWKLW